MSLPESDADPVSPLAQSEPDVDIHLVDIGDAVAAHFAVRLLDLKSERRTADVVRPRQIGMYLGARLTLRSLVQIGRFWGDRDHTTVLHAVRKIDSLLERDAGLASLVEGIAIASRSIALHRRVARPAPGETETPLDIARRIQWEKRRGRMRAATSASANNVLDLCAEVIRLSERCDDLESVLLPRPIALPDAPADAPPLPELIGAVHDFLAAEALYRKAPRAAMREARDDLALRLRRWRGPQIAACVDAFEATLRAEHTPGERDATERYREAVRLLAKWSGQFSYLMEEEREEAE